MRRLANPFKGGDLVWEELHQLSDASKQFTAKLVPRRGPFKIVKMVSENVSIFRERETKQEFGPVNIVQLTPYRPPVIENLV